jgi:hypothetical protein
MHCSTEGLHVKELVLGPTNRVSNYEVHHLKEIPVFGE